MDGDTEEHLGKSWSVVLTGGQWDVCSASDLKLLAVLGCANLLVHRCAYIYIYYTLYVHLLSFAAYLI